MQLLSLCLDDVKELIKKRNQLTKENDKLSKPVDVLRKCVLAIYNNYHREK